MLIVSMQMPLFLMHDLMSKCIAVFHPVKESNIKKGKDTVGAS